MELGYLPPRVVEQDALGDSVNRSSHYCSFGIRSLLDPEGYESRPSSPQQYLPSRVTGWCGRCLCPMSPSPRPPAVPCRPRILSRLLPLSHTIPSSQTNHPPNVPSTRSTSAHPRSLRPLTQPLPLPHRPTAEREVEKSPGLLLCPLVPRSPVTVDPAPIGARSAVLPNGSHLPPSFHPICMCAPLRGQQATRLYFLQPAFIVRCGFCQVLSLRDQAVPLSFLPPFLRPSSGCQYRSRDALTPE